MIVDLEIPDAAITALYRSTVGSEQDDPAAEVVAAVAAPVVAAELRRLADGFDKIAAGSIGWVIRQDAASLRARADELDAGGAR
jgi:hypothetical protein